jgi:hypothetical protein
MLRFPWLYRTLVRWGLRTSSPRQRLRQSFLREQVRSGWAAAARRDFELMSVRYAPNIVYESTPQLVVLGMPARVEGINGWLRALSDFNDAWARSRFELSFILDCGKQLVTLGCFAGHGAASGIDAQTDFAQVLELDDGLVVRERDFNDWSDALRAAGIDADMVARLEALPPGAVIEL